MRILIVKTSSLGDIIHTYPVVHYLKEHYPEATLHWLVEKRCAQLVERHPLVDKAITLDRKALRASRQKIRQEQYDLLFDLQGNCKSALLTWCARATTKVGFSWSCVPEWPNVLATHQRFAPSLPGNIRHDYLSIVQQHFGHESLPPEFAETKLMLTPEEESMVEVLPIKEPSLLLCPGSAWPNKQLALEQLQQLLTHYPNHQVWIAWGSDEEKELAHSIGAGELLPKLSLPSLQGVMRRVNLVISMDSLPLHLAGTTGTPTLSFFGPSNGDKYRPVGSQHKAIQGACPYGRVFAKRCPVLRTCSTGACLKDLDLNLGAKAEA